MGVAEAAPAATRSQRHLARGDEIGEQLARGVVEDGRSGRHVEHEVVARLAMPARAFATPARSCTEVMLVPEVTKGCLTRVDAKPDRATPAAVAAIRSPARNVCLAPEGRGARAAVAGAQPDLDLVEEHAGSFSHRLPEPSASDRRDPLIAGGVRQ